MEQATYQRMSIGDAIDTLQVEYKLSNYRLAKILGVQPIMIKHYKDNKVKSVNTKVAHKLYKTYGILVDSFNTVEELERCHQSDIEQGN